MATTVSKSPSKPSIREKVQNVIDLIRPAVQADGGDIELVDVSGEGVVQIRFHGALPRLPQQPHRPCKWGSRKTFASRFRK